MLTQCQHKIESPQPIQYFKGKAQVFDKIKNKTDYVYFQASVEYPLRLRLDVDMTMLGIPVGQLVIDNEKATLLSLTERKAYQTEQSSLLLERLLKTKIAAYDITSAFAERFPLSRAWSCRKTGNENACTNSGVTLKHVAEPEQNLQMIIESERSKVTMIYQATRSGSDKFEVKVPKDFEVISIQ